MEYISTYLADRMCRNDIIKEDDVKFYAYSIQLMLERVIGFTLIGIFALVFKAFFEIAIFTVVFSLIRASSDGIHCKTSIGCFISSVLTALSTIPLSNLLINYPFLCMASVVLSAGIIFYIGTIRDPNMDLSDMEFIHLKKRSRIGISILSPIILGLLLILPDNHLVYYAALGVIYNALSLIAVKILKREVSNNEET